jgi:hypothetical protein
MPDYRIMKTDQITKDDKTTWLRYRSSCDCTDPECDLTIDFEYNKNISGMLFMNFYKRLHWSSYYGDANILIRFWRRIKCATRVLFKGYIEVEETHVFQGIQHIEKFIEVLHEAKKIMVENAGSSVSDSQGNQKPDRVDSDDME